MLARYKWLAEGVLWTGLLGSLGTLYYWASRPNEILFLDRPRQAMAQPDWILRYLTVSQTPFHFKEGFLCLEDSPEVRRRLLTLVDLLSRSLAGVAQNERSLLDPARYKPVSLSLNAYGSLEILPDSKSWNQTGERIQRMQQLAWQREDLVGQYQTTLAAVKSIYPSAVGSPTTVATSIEPLERHAAPPLESPTRARGVIQPVSADEMIELSDVEAESSKTP